MLADYLTRTVGIACVAAAVMSTSATAVTARENDKPATSEFAGKIVLVFLDQMRVPSVVMSSVEIRDIGGRSFLVGVGADTRRDADWWAGRHIRIAWNSVNGYVLFGQEEFEKYLEDETE